MRPIVLELTGLGIATAPERHAGHAFEARTRGMRRRGLAERVRRIARSPWIAPVPAVHPDAEVYERRARALRAAAFREVLGGLVRGVVAPIRRWHRTRVTRRQLHALDDRLLLDIGITRSDIDAVARGIWRPSGNRDAVPLRREPRPAHVPGRAGAEWEHREAA